MKEIFVSNFGPIKEGFERGMMPIYPVTVFIGNQGSGKSTMAKLISTFSWLEKAMIRGDIKEKWITRYNRFVKNHCAYHGIQDYFKDNTILRYKGKEYKFIYEEKKLSVIKLDNRDVFLMPQIMYVPAERNFISVIEDAEKIKKLPRPLSTMLAEYDNARKSLSSKTELPIEGYSFQYNKQHKTSWLIGEDFKLRLHNAASGFQSLIPLVLVTRYLSNKISNRQENGLSKLSLEINEELKKRIEKVLLDDSLDEEIRNSLISQLSSLYQNDCFWNIVEEPEQNLFPKSQKNILAELLAAFNSHDGNGLVITTHSPYIINYLTIAIKASELDCKDENCKERLEAIFPENARVGMDKVRIYEIDDKGRISELETFMNIPSDENYLNVSLRETDELFGELLEIQDLCVG